MGKYEPTKLGAKIKKLRIGAKLSRPALAREAGVSVQTVCGLELGYPDHSHPTLTTLCLIAEALGVGPVELLSNE
jgi:transcriptional regulator with XRE-family HTH domain